MSQEKNILHERLMDKIGELINDDASVICGQTQKALRDAAYAARRTGDPRYQDFHNQICRAVNAKSTTIKQRLRRIMDSQPKRLAA